MSRQPRVSSLLVSRKSGELRGSRLGKDLVDPPDSGTDVATLAHKASIALDHTAQLVESVAIASNVRASRSRATTPVRPVHTPITPTAHTAQSPSPTQHTNSSTPKRKVDAAHSDIEAMQTPVKKARGKTRSIAAASTDMDSPHTATPTEELPPLESAGNIEIIGQDIVIVETTPKESIIDATIPTSVNESSSQDNSITALVPDIPTAAPGRSRRGMAMLAMTTYGVPQPPSASATSRTTTHAAPLSSALAAVATAAATANINARTMAAVAAAAAAANISAPTTDPRLAITPRPVSPVHAASSTVSSVSAFGTAGLISSPFKSSADLQSRLNGLLRGVLPFPTALHSLLAVFHAIDTVLLMERGRSAGSYPTSWETSLQPSVQRLHPRTNVTLQQLQQLITLFPAAYVLTEAHRVNKFGKLIRDYRVSFGTGTDALINPDLDDKSALISSVTSSLSNSKHSLINLEYRRNEIESRMLHYVYEQHQRFLQRLLQQTQHDALLTPGASASATASAAAGIPTPISAIESFLSAPLSHLRGWYPSFGLDNIAHCPPPAMTPLPDTELQAMLARSAHTESGAGLLGLANRRQAIPSHLSLNSEQRGVPNSTSHGSGRNDTDGNNAAVVSAATITPHVSASAAAPSPVNRSLSILSADLVSSFRASLAKNAAASLAIHGDPEQRERLRQLHRLRPLYESINFASSSMKRFNFPLTELFAKTSPNADPQTVRASLNMLLELIPTWARLDITSNLNQPPKEILRVTPTRACIDPVTGRDKFLPIIENAIKQCEMNIQARNAPMNIVSAPSENAGNLIPIVTDSHQSGTIVKQEPLDVNGIVDVSEITVKTEFDGLAQTSAQLASAASSIAARAVARAHAAHLTTPSIHTNVSYAAGLTSSPLKSRTNKLSRAAAIALTASGKKIHSNALPSSPLKPKPSAASSFTQRLGSMR
jgi:hypothetical protein